MAPIVVGCDTAGNTAAVFWIDEARRLDSNWSYDLARPQRWWLVNSPVVASPPQLSRKALASIALAAVREPSAAAPARLQHRAPRATRPSRVACARRSRSAAVQHRRAVRGRA